MFIFSDSSLCRTRQPAWSPGLVVTTTSRRFLLANTGFQYASESSTRRRCLCGSVYTMQPSLFGWPVCAGPLRTWWPATAFHGVWDSAGPARPDCYGACSFAVNGPRTWNSLPADLRTPDTTLCSFKRHLKAHLFQQYNNNNTYLP